MRSTITPTSGTSSDLIEAAERWARIAARSECLRGFDGDDIRRHIVGRFRSEFDGEGDEYERETLMAAVQRGVESVLATVA